MKISSSLKEIILNIENIDPLEFFGINNKKLKILQEQYPEVKILARGSEIKIISNNAPVLQKAELHIQKLIAYCEKHASLPENQIQNTVNDFLSEDMPEAEKDWIILHTPNNKPIKARTPNQYKLVQSVEHNDIVFAVGPAGTGKTYTSVALAVRALKNKEVKRIILTRPAVEAGENLGFLPGDMREKIDPYLRPLYDALFDMMPGDKFMRHLENKTIEIAPLAFMRGRTLDNAFVILDEAQNCSNLQLKMFLTRMGPTARFIVTGDLTQIDLPPSQKSGLLHAIRILKGIKGIDILEFTVEDVTRHRIVKDIIMAYSEKK
jgi:phosphate starvation-inducible protein PhoH and related proteins